MSEQDLQEDVDALAEYLWTSGKTHAVVNGNPNLDPNLNPNPKPEA